MNHYQKIATVVIRSFGALLTLYGIVNLAITLSMAIELSFRNGLEQTLPVAGQGGFLNVNLYYGVVGAIIFSPASRSVNWSLRA